MALLRLTSDCWMKSSEMLSNLNSFESHKWIITIYVNNFMLMPCHLIETNLYKFQCIFFYFGLQIKLNALKMSLNNTWKKKKAFWIFCFCSIIYLFGEMEISVFFFEKSMCFGSHLTGSNYDRMGDSGEFSLGNL